MNTTANNNNNNRISRIVAKFSAWPNGLRVAVLSRILGRVVPMVGTANIRYEVISASEVVCSMKNQRKMQNHIKGIHAVAVGLLAETATGFVTAMNLPDDRILLIKSLHADYKRLCQGNMKARATLSAEQRQYISDTQKGELSIPIVISDEAGDNPVVCEMIWAWLPKKRSV